MTIRFTARVAGSSILSDERCLVAGVAEDADGADLGLVFQCSVDDPSPQDVALGMDSYCVVTHNQGTAYGCVDKLMLEGGLLRVTFRDDALFALGLDDRHVEVRPAVDAAQVDSLRQGLDRILAFGQADARPPMPSL